MMYVNSKKGLACFKNQTRIAENKSLMLTIMRFDSSQNVKCWKDIWPLKDCPLLAQRRVENMLFYMCC